jgi:Cof subfamily protein (haloacid dehalogenase superfamily)
MIATVAANIRAVASDVDGTLTRPDLQISSRTRAAIRETRSQGITFIPATGKGPLGAQAALGPELPLAELHGVYLNGLLVLSPGERVVFERLLDPSIGEVIVQYCKEHGLSLLGYSGSHIVCETRDSNIDGIMDYHEPMPKEIGGLRRAFTDGYPIHKLIVISSRGASSVIDHHRPKLEALLGDTVAITQAMSHMLEFLPAGGGKSEGLQHLLNSIGVDKGQVLAMGDAQNDIGMLQLAGTSVAMGQAEKSVRKYADFITVSNANDGAALALEKILLAR